MRIMLAWFSVCITLGSILPVTLKNYLSPSKLETVAELEGVEVGNLLLTSNDRIFLTTSSTERDNFNLVEIKKDGSSSEYPINSLSNNTHPISAKSDNKDVMWFLTEEVKKGNSKNLYTLVGWNVLENKLEKKLTIPSSVLNSQSTLQDFTIDDNSTFYIVDLVRDNEAGESKELGLITVDKNSGKSTRMILNHSNLHNIHSSSLSEPASFSIDKSDEWVYFGNSYDTNIYRISTNQLWSEPNSSLDIELYRKKPLSSGFKVDHHGDIFLADIEKGSIGVVKKAGYQSIVQDREKLTGNLDLAISSDGHLYISDKGKQSGKNSDFKAFSTIKKVKLLIEDPS